MPRQLKPHPEYYDNFDGDYTDEERERYCEDSCPHYDSLNQCCWQATEKGLCFKIQEGDLCHLGYSNDDGR